MIEGKAPSVEELRGAPRFTLLVRMAKLVVDGREYLCVLRDASATGCKVKLFHAMPQARQIELETGSGDRYPMDLMWYRDDHAGFRFHHEIDVHRLIEDNRGIYPKRQIRVRVEQKGYLYADGQTHEVTVRDISQQGACVEISHRLMLRQLIKLEMPGFPAIYAKVCWRQQPRHGLVFETGFGLDELANNIMKMHDLSLHVSGRGPGGGQMRAAS
ncbi:PilZ domain-containing protein [Novosphingobium sp. FSY-8]|uniref:PilZ domain-containing protein n=1 Tax=Novosphingobium ovatum TaxID=1908523 RepID=A0ABW9XA36_9SPHN|nr:PilZ domain-containing protein [Novosphingobium ovatum]NBC35390.1 PilZ domain-containing protein [Novosphingobium ovatum]